MNSLNPFLLIIMLFSFALTSCSDEEIFNDFIAENTKQEEVDSNDDSDDSNSDSDDSDTIENPVIGPLGKISETPCDYLLSDLAANSTTAIDCRIDLEGQTINLSSNIKLNFNGGEIINGTLNFNGGTIDGKLLNHTLNIEGNVELKEEVFLFYAERWDITQGKVSDDVALKNREDINSLIDLVKDLGATTFNIDEFDGYFKINPSSDRETPQSQAISIPSNFNFIMSGNTHLRMQPHGYPSSALLTVSESVNVLVQGGNLHGDRDEHDYSSGGPHAWGHLVLLKASNDIVVREVTMMDASGDGLIVNALGHAFSSDYDYSFDITVTDNIFIRNRRNNLTITDGRDIVVENNEFIDAGIHTQKSQGVAPGFAIDVEAVRVVNGVLREFEIAEDIIIRNNSETGSRLGGFTVHTGDRVTLEGNRMENQISFSTSIGTIIRDNIFVASTDFQKNNRTAIVAGREDRYDRNYGNLVYGNEITGYSTGIIATNKDIKVYDNTIKECITGIKLNTIRDAEVYSNEIISARPSSDGIVPTPGNEYLDNVLINENIVEVERNGMQFVNVNNTTETSNFKVNITGNSINKNGVTFSKNNGFTFSDNTIKDGRLRIVNFVNSTISGNIINSTSSDGIRIDEGCQNLLLENNDISVTGRYNCINYNANDSVNITERNNSCN